MSRLAPGEKRLLYSPLFAAMLLLTPEEPRVARVSNRLGAAPRLLDVAVALTGQRGL